MCRVGLIDMVISCGTAGMLLRKSALSRRGGLMHHAFSLRYAILRGRLAASDIDEDAASMAARTQPREVGREGAVRSRVRTDRERW